MTRDEHRAAWTRALTDATGLPVAPYHGTGLGLCLRVWWGTPDARRTAAVVAAGAPTAEAVAEALETLRERGWGSP